MFQIYVKTSNEESAPWELYGVFQTEDEWKKEIAHIQYLRSIGPIYMRRESEASGSKYGDLS